jgi:hypothetical protein
VNLIALGQIGHRRPLRTAASATFAFSAASIVRLVFDVIMRSVYQSEQPLPTNHMATKSGSISQPQLPMDQI